MKVEKSKGEAWQRRVADAIRLIDETMNTAPELAAIVAMNDRYETLALLLPDYFALPLSVVTTLGDDTPDLSELRFDPITRCFIPAQLHWYGGRA